MSGPAARRQGGSVYVGDQKLAIKVPRVRDRDRNIEVPLRAYQALQEPRHADDLALRKVLRGLSCRDYACCVDAIGETFGVSASSVSRRFRRASEKKLREFQERRLESLDLSAVFLDGKTFGEDEMVIAMGVTMSGEKTILGFVQTATENEIVCAKFLQSLVERGLSFKQGVLAVIDGAKGLHRAVKKVFGDFAAIQRCQWHKRENVVSYLSKGQKETFRRKMQNAYQQPMYAAAKTALLTVRSELLTINQSAVASLDEGLEETLTLHRLGVFAELGQAFKTTNCIENVNSLLARRTDKVSRWKNSDQKHRWLASALLETEPRLNRIDGFRHLKQLRIAIQSELKISWENVA